MAVRHPASEHCEQEHAEAPDVHGGAVGYPVAALGGQEACGAHGAPDWMRRVVLCGHAHVDELQCELVFGAFGGPLYKQDVLRLQVSVQVPAAVRRATSTRGGGGGGSEEQKPGALNLSPSPSPSSTKERKGKERKGKERKGKERRGEERRGEERRGEERRGEERNGKERKGSS